MDQAQCLKSSQGGSLEALLTALHEAGSSREKLLLSSNPQPNACGALFFKIQVLLLLGSTGMAEPRQCVLLTDPKGRGRTTPQSGRPHGEGEGPSVDGGREKHGQQPFLWFSQEEQASQGPQA